MCEQRSWVRGAEEGHSARRPWLRRMHPSCHTPHTHNRFALGPWRFSELYFIKLKWTAIRIALEPRADRELYSAVIEYEIVVTRRKNNIK